MKNICVLILLLTISSHNFSQVIVQNIDWRVGDLKYITAEVKGKVTENGVVKKDTAMFSRSELLVNEESDSCYIIHIKTDNQLLELGHKFYEGLLEDYTNSAFMEFDVKVSKDSLSTEVLNKKELDESLCKTRDEIVEILIAKVPHKSEQATAQLNELLPLIQQKEGLLNLLDLIIQSYKIEYSNTDTLFTTDSVANPFNLQHFNGATLKTYTEKSDVPGAFNIVVEKGYDFEAYKNLISQMANQAVGVVGDVIDSKDYSNTMNKMGEVFSTLLRSYEFGASDSFVVTRKIEQNWPIRISHKTDLKIKSNSNESIVLVDALVDIK